MKSRSDHDSAALRRAAEARLQERSADRPPKTEADLRRLQHELEVHQIELEMQNEQLRQVAAEIEAERERYSDLYDFAPAGYFNFSVEGIIQLVNLSGATLMGIERSRLIGQRFEPFLVETDRPRFNNLLKQVFTTGVKQTCDLTLKSDDDPGRNICLEGMLSSDGKDCRAILIDVTARKRLEEQLREAQKLESIGQLAGGVAHDFNNILAAIMIQTEVTAMIQDLPQQVRDGLAEIRLHTERAANLTRQLLQYSRRHVMRSRDLDLNRVINDLAGMLQDILGSEARLQLRLSAGPLMIHADAEMLEQVLIVLATNAREAMSAGGRLLIETAEKTLEENVTRLIPDAAPGRYVCLSVRDTGSGISPEVLPRIFEPFFTTKDVGKGTGLSLAMVFGIVKQHYGWIKVDSAHGRGTTFEIFLPASQVSTEVLAKSVLHPSPRDGSETILLVEDEAMLRKLVRGILERRGYTVLAAANGVEALDLWREHGQNVKLLLTDLVMPAGLNGLELARRLRTVRPQLKVIFTSGYSAEFAGREFQLPKGERFLEKPFAPAELLEVVRQCLAEGKG